MSKTRGVIIGFGGMGKLHLDRYERLGVEIIGIIDNDRDKRFQIFENNIQAYASLDDFIKRSGQAADFIDICLPTHLHFAAIKEVTEKFAEKPIPICVEKPVVRTNQEAHELDKLAKQYPAMIFVAECEHYNTPLMKFMRSVPDISHIDMIRMVNLQYFTLGKRSWLLNEKESGGIMLDLMIHDLSVLNKIGGKAEKIIDAVCHQRKYTYTDEASIDLQYKKFTATVIGSWLADDILHPITTTVVITDTSGRRHTLKLNDYMEPKAKDPYLVELAFFVDAVIKKENPQRLSTYTRAVRLANQAVWVANQKLVDAPIASSASVLVRKPF